MSGPTTPAPASDASQPQPANNKSNKGIGCLGIIILCLLIGWIADMAGCNKPSGNEADNKHYPYETSLVDSHGNGGWVLFDSAPESYEPGHTVALEEQTQVRVTGASVRGLTSDTKLYPVTVLSGKCAGRSGWVISTALPPQ